MKKLKQIIFCILAGVFLVSASSVSILANPVPGPGGNNNHTHGSAEKVTEDMLKTEADIDSDYDVNTSTQAKASSGAYKKLFDTENIQDFNLTIDENNWNYMLQNANEKPNVLADEVSIGDETIQYCSIKTKGNLTLDEIWNSDSDRFSFTVNFGKYIKKKNGYSDTQNFYGLNKVALNNIYGDASLMKEYLSYKLMAEMGVDAPYCTLVNLYVNDEFYGIYCMVESMDSALTQRTTNEKSDYLVKPESSGGDLVYDSALDKYINADGDFEFDSIDYPTSSSNPLYKYSGLWEDDEDTFNDVVDMLPTVFKWLKTLNELSNSDNSNSQEYKDSLENIIDVDKLVRYFAVNTYLVNLDSYQSEKAHNYGLYINKNGFANVLPWDYNFSFGGYGVSDATEMVNFSISNPLINCTLTERPLLNVIMQNDEYKALFNKYLKDCTTIATEGGTTSDSKTYNANYFSTILDRISVEITETYANDPTAFYTVAQYKTATSSLKQLIKDRSTAVLKQLDGDTTTVETLVDLRSIGNVTGGSIPGQNPGESESVTLKDSETGISVEGMFPQDAKLVVTKVTSGDNYNSAKNKITSSGLLMYDITVNMGNPPSDQGGDNENIPQDPNNSQVGDDSNPPKEPNGDQIGDGSNPPQKPNGDQIGNPNNQSFKVSFPVSSDMKDFTIYMVDQNSQITKQDGTLENNEYIVTTNTLGNFVVSYTTNSDQSNENNLNDNDNNKNDEQDGKTSPKTGDTSNIILWISLLVASAGGIYIIRIGKKKIK